MITLLEIFRTVCQRITWCGEVIRTNNCPPAKLWPITEMVWYRWQESVSHFFDSPRRSSRTGQQQPWKAWNLTTKERVTTWRHTVTHNCKQTRMRRAWSDLQCADWRLCWRHCAPVCRRQRRGSGRALHARLCPTGTRSATPYRPRVLGPWCCAPEVPGLWRHQVCDAVPPTGTRSVMLCPRGTRSGWRERWSWAVPTDRLSCTEWRNGQPGRWRNVWTRSTWSSDWDRSAEHSRWTAPRAADLQTNESDWHTLTSYTALLPATYPSLYSFQCRRI